MTVYLEQAAWRRIISHAEGGYPNEICGILYGAEQDGSRRIVVALPIENAFAARERFHRYSITPDDLLRAERQARQQGLDVLGVYHSHPDDAGVPSDYDRDHAAWTTWSYLIVSVPRGHAAAIRAWSLHADRSGFTEEPTEMCD